jgi:hypothetical protein
MTVVLDAPPQVKRAFALLWLSVLIGVVQAVYETVTLPTVEDYVWVALVLVLGIMAIYAAIVVLASHRRNWARYALLVWTVGGAFTYFWGLGGESPSRGDMIVFVSLLMDLVALYWLFTAPGKLWYRP